MIQFVANIFNIAQINTIYQVDSTFKKKKHYNNQLSHN